MTCQDISSEHLSAYVDGQLSPAERDPVTHHLEACGPCRARLAFHVSAQAAVKATPVVPTPPGLKEKILAGAREVQMQHTMDRSGVRNGVRPRSPWKLWVPAAAALLLVAVVVWIVARPRTGEPVVTGKNPEAQPRPAEQAPSPEKVAIKPAPKAGPEATPEKETPIQPAPAEKEPEKTPAVVQKKPDEVPQRQTAQEAAPLGRVVQVHNSLYRQRQGETTWQPLSTGADLSSTDSIRTDAGGKAALVFDNQQILCLNQDTQVQIVRGEDSTTLTMYKGEVLLSHTSGRTLGPAESRRGGRTFQIITPAGKASGSDAQCDIHSSGDQTTLTVVTGEVQMTNTHGTSNVTRNQQVRTTPKAAPSAPVAVDPHQNLAWVAPLAEGEGPHRELVHNVMAQEKPGKPDQKAIDQAIEKGAKYLIKHYEKGITPASSAEFELVIYTLIHADANPQDVPLLKQGIEDLMNYDYFGKGAAAPQPKTRVKATPQGVSPFTYRVALRSLALHALLVNIASGTKGYAEWKPKAESIQKSIADSAQALVDSQVGNGMWTYTGALTQEPEAIKNISTGKWNEGTNKENKTASKEAWQNASHLTGVLYKLKPKYGTAKGTDIKAPKTVGGGDNSNTQYGILGLIAAQYSGVEVPQSTWDLALKWFESAQSPEGGFGYHDTSKQTTTTKRTSRASPVYGSMTTAGTVGLAAGYKYLGKDFKDENRFKNALEWLGKNFSVSGNPGTSFYLYYYLYGLERAAAFANADKLGTHDWYAEGAEFLIKNQDASGGWSEARLNVKNNKNGNATMSPTDTSFAILFLKRATRHMIDTGEKFIDSGGQKFIDNK